MKKYLFILITLFVAGYLASKVQSSWGKVRVQSIKIPTQNGQWLVADLFKPVSAYNDAAIGPRTISDIL